MNEDKKPRAPLVKLTSLWEKTRARDGAVYLQGRLGAMRILVMRNEKKQTDADPDWNVLLATIEETPRPGREVAKSKEQDETTAELFD